MKTTFCLVALIVAGARVCSSQTVLNGSFETGATPPFGGTFIPAPDSTSIPGWTVQSGSVDYIGSDTWPAADGSRSLDMSGHDAGAISQNISGFMPGSRYRLSFYMAGNNDGAARIFHLEASIGSTAQIFNFDATGYTYANMGWTLVTMDFTADSTTMALTFTSLDPGAAGPALDNVTLSALSEPDSDGDGVPDSIDLCPNTAPGAIVDAHGCSIDQLVPCAGPASGGTWKNHGDFVSHVVHKAREFLAAGLISEAQRKSVVAAAAKSDCGKSHSIKPRVERVGRKIHIKFAGSTGSHYVIEASTNLTEWVAIGVPNDLGNGSFQFEDEGNLPFRFYRVVAR